MNNYQFDSLKFVTEGLTGGACTVIADEKGLPSFMIPINKRTNAQLFDGGSEKTHSAFIVDDVEYKRFFFSKFINCVVDGLAYSWPLMDPMTSIDYDASHAACNAKGTGWHMASIPERAVINHLIYKSGFIPRGNTQYGKHHTYTYEVGELTKSDGSGVTVTGSGPATWFHDGTRNGIADYVGNVWKWASGMRVYDGELQIFVGNLAAKQVSHAADSTYWKAVLPNGSLVEPGTSGTLKYTKDCKIATDAGVTGKGSISSFGSLAAGTGVSEIPEILKELFLAPAGGFTHTGAFFINNEGERIPMISGCYGDASNAGPSTLSICELRTRAGSGFFSAYMELEPES